MDDYGNHLMIVILLCQFFGYCDGCMQAMLCQDNQTHSSRIPFLQGVGEMGLMLFVLEGV